MVLNGKRRNLGDPDRSSIMEYLPTSRKGKEVETLVRESDMFIVVMKQGNACGAKGHAPIETHKGKPRNRLWRSLNKVAYPSTRRMPGN
jgi:hypothetical protein